MARLVKAGLLAVFLVVIMMPGRLAGGSTPSGSIIINLPSRTLEFYRQDELIKEYPIAVGKPSTPTPLGQYYIIDKQVNPWWFPPGKNYSVPSGPDNPLGYRWMGFLPTYGIHGTNMPWSIGSAVSNGCIRMYEEDVEELYDMVEYYTPVHITYQRIKLRIDRQGQASLGIYPDIYGYQHVTISDVKNVLASRQLDVLADETFLLDLLERQPDKQVVFAKVYHIKLNGKNLNGFLVFHNGKFYAPVDTVAREVNIMPSWDEDEGIVSVRQKSAEGVRIGRQVYVDVEGLVNLFGGWQRWEFAANCYYIQMPSVVYRDTVIHSDTHILATEGAVAALPLAQAVGENLKWHEERKELRQGVRKIPVEFIDDKPYIKIDKLGEYLNVKAVRDEQYVYRLDYPLYAVDYSRDIHLMADFF